MINGSRPPKAFIKKLIMKDTVAATLLKPLAGLGFIAAVLAHASSSSAMPAPPPPKAQIVGQAGGRTACYWVYAESAEKTQAGDFPGKITDLSAPCVVKNLPDRLDSNNKVRLTISPVAGAVRYHILRTERLPAPHMEIKVRKPGTNDLYYWVQGHNGWRSSELAGPFPVKCDPDDCENELTVSAGSPLQWKQSLWVTQTPAPPFGRKLHLVALLGPHSEQGPAKYPRVIIHKSDNFVTWGPGPFEATPAEAKPEGRGRFLLASTSELTVEDFGQELQMVVAPNANETLEQSFEQRLTTTQSSRYGAFKGIELTSVFRDKTSAENDFYGWYRPLSLNVRAESGGIYNYQCPPVDGGCGGYKSTFSALQTELTTKTVGQYVVQGATLNAYGAGDSVVQDLTANLYGGNREGGDEGGSLLRTFTTRGLREGGAVTLARNAPPGSRHLEYSGQIEGASGRILINLSRTRSLGRIDHVVNCDVYSEGTDWRPEHAGWFISFDIDNVGTKRSWCNISEVLSPTHVRVVMHTNWRRDANLGYSRFIYNPARGQTLPSLKAAGLTYGGAEGAPSDALFTSLKLADKEKLKGKGALYTNPAAIGTLPKALEGAAAQGGYQMAPGTHFDDPWNERGLHVEPLTTEWKAGDKLLAAIGTCQTMSISWGWLDGELGPNDWVQGYNCGSFFQNRPANGIAFNSYNMGIGMRIELPKDKQGNGVIVNGDPLDGAFIAAPDVPILRCYHSPDLPYLQGSSQGRAMDIRTEHGDVPLSVRHDTVALGGILKGNDRTRGKAVFSGDGTTKTFTIRFRQPFTVEPIVTLSGNQFARTRVAQVSKEAVEVAFEEAPASGQDNVIIWWMAQE